MKKYLARGLAASLAALMPLSMATHTASSASAAPVSAQAVAGNAKAAELYWDELPGTVNPSTNGRWVSEVKKLKSTGHNVTYAYATSPAMGGLEIPLVVIGPKGKKLRETAGLPTLYMLNGADGGEGRANWINQSDIIDFYGKNLNANIVIPMSGAFSYYTDWVNKYSRADYKPMWETFLTKELPQTIEKELKANGKRAIAGMSMSATSSLNLAAHNQGFYDSVGSFSGCASTTKGLAPAFIGITLARGGTNVNEMWGGSHTPAALRDDALVNAKNLVKQPNLYVSNASGLVGKHDVLSSERVRGDLSAATTVAVEGGVIEAATNGCTHDLDVKLRFLGKKDATFNFRNTGTHQWGYWQDDLRDYLPVLNKAFGN
ncbi:alpha/beta hydrolase [Corynebacterium urealyticum]|uniref:alpha/beta hydrolase n=1 Tax=Corynebacterium urealyticum TaxID=43771 RepID=UPI0011E7A40F|nr:alpha/beta hydrolase family protein [Corynebacterium urealyticum]TYR15140.1 esterase family protein [Corynebacterium urealyticum]TYR18733.1 esterase family protein [Corynebacterium urealyticum]TYT20346.1 esterase family protein [Corynebacterium urealyticum]